MAAKNGTLVKVITDTSESEKNLKGVIEKLDETNKLLNKISKNKGFESQNKEIEKVSKKLDINAKKISKIGNAFKLTGITAIFAGLSKIGKQTSKMIDSSASYVENLNLMQVAFQDTRDAAEGFVNGLSDIYGLDESSMTRQLGYYRQIGNALAIDSYYADMLAKNLLKMQLDMSSLYNLSFERSGEVLQASMAGQTKPIRGSTGADITQSSLQTDLDRLGINRAVTDLSRAEKSILIYLSLERQLVASQGDLAKTINTTANQQKIFSEQTQRLSRVMGNVLTPVFTKVLYVANGFLMALNEIIQLFATLVGFEIPEYDESSYGLPDYFDDVADSAESASKKLSGLRGFDKLNNITTPNTGGAGGADLGGVDQRLLDALTEYDLKLSGIRNKATEIRDKIMEWLGFTKNVDKATGEITWKYDTLGKSAEQIAREVGNNLGKKLTEFTNNIDWEKYGENIAKGLNISFGFVNSFIDSYSWVGLGSNLAKGLNKLLDTVNWTDIGKALTNKFKIMIETLYGFVSKLDWGKLGDAIGESINGAIENIDISKILGTIVKTLTGLLEALGRAIVKLDFSKLIIPTAVLVSFGKLKSYLKSGEITSLLSGTFIAPLKNLGKLLKDDLAGGFTGLTNAMGKSLDMWSRTMTASQKLGVTLLGATGAVVGIQKLWENMEKIKDEGPSVSNVLGSIGSATGTIVGNAMAGASVGGVYGAIIGASVGLIESATTAILGLVYGTKEVEYTLGEGSQMVISYQEKLNSLTESARENAEVTLGQTARAQELTKELANYVDSNGNVTGSVEEVNTILNTLNDLMGTNYELNGNVITSNGNIVTSYQDIESEIARYCDSLRAEALLESYRDVYLEKLKENITLQEKIKETQDKIAESTKGLDLTNQKTYDKWFSDNHDILSDLFRLNGQLESNTKYAENYEKASAEATLGIYNNVQSLVSDTNATTGKGIEISANFLRDAIDKNKKEVQKTKVSTLNDLKDIENKIKNYSTLNPNVTIDVNANTYNARQKFNKLITDMNNTGITGVNYSTLPFYADGGFPEDGWFRASHGELMGKFDNGETVVANNKQITDGIRQAVMNGAMDAIVANNGNSKNVNVTIVAEDNGLLNAIKFQEKERDRQYGY